MHRPPHLELDPPDRLVGLPLPPEIRQPRLAPELDLRCLVVHACQQRRADAEHEPTQPPAHRVNLTAVWLLILVAQIRRKKPTAHPRPGDEPGETPEAAVVRELKEELVAGEPTVVRHLGTVDTDDDVSRWWGKKFRNGYRMDHIQVAVNPEDLTLIDHEELLRADWLDLDHVAEATAALPGDLAQAAVRFAREATAAEAARDMQHTGGSRRGSPTPRNRQTRSDPSRQLE